MAKLIDTSMYRTDDGEQFTVYTYQDVISAPSKDDPHGTIDGLKWMELASGEKINYVDKDTLRFVHRGQRLLHRI